MYLYLYILFTRLGDAKRIKMARRCSDACFHETWVQAHIGFAGAWGRWIVQICHEGCCRFHNLGYWWVSSSRHLYSFRQKRGPGNISGHLSRQARWVFYPGEWQVLLGNRWNFVRCHRRGCRSQGLELVRCSVDDGAWNAGLFWCDNLVKAYSIQ